MKIIWRSRDKELPEPDRSCLIFSPQYKNESCMRMRIMEGQFVKHCTDAKQWVYIDEIEPKEKK